MCCVTIIHNFPLDYDGSDPVLLSHAEEVLTVGNVSGTSLEGERSLVEAGDVGVGGRPEVVFCVCETYGCSPAFPHLLRCWQSLDSTTTPITPPPTTPRHNFPPLVFFFFCRGGLVCISSEQASSCMRAHPARRTNIGIQVEESPVYGEPQERQSKPIVTDQRRNSSLMGFLCTSRAQCMSMIGHRCNSEWLCGMLAFREDSYVDALLAS